MMKRTVNKRPTYDTPNIKEPVSFNYYPITSAIAAINTDNQQVTVMTDRAQGGTMYKTGRIELMQNRRMYFDDGRGVNEALNETNQYGFGLQVPASYYIQLFNKQSTQSFQRIRQVETDQPLMQFYAFGTFDVDPKFKWAENPMQSPHKKVYGLR